MIFFFGTALIVQAERYANRIYEKGLGTVYITDER